MKLPSLTITGNLHLTKTILIGAPTPPLETIEEVRVATSMYDDPWAKPVAPNLKRCLQMALHLSF